MNLRKLVLPLLVALACVGAGVTVLPAAAAPGKPTHKSHAKATRKLRIDAVKVGTKVGPLVVRVAAGVHTELGMTLNGKHVVTSFEFAGPKAQQVELRTGDGLRAGSNKLRIRSSHAGVVRTATRSVKVPGWALLADAGEDVGTATHVHARVGTAPAPGAAPGSGVDYHWSIVDGPQGAKADIVDDSATRPVLQTAEPGTYLLQEEVDPEGSNEPTSYDQTTVAVAPNDPPIGVPINTLAAGGAIKIGDKSYGGFGPLSYAVVERTTRTVVESSSVVNDAAGIQKLSDLASKYGSGANYMRYLMIISGERGIPAARLDAFADVMKKIGVALPTEEHFLALKYELAYSMIGIPGAPAGAATIRIPGGGYNPAVSGAITGYLQKNQAVDADGTPLYEYVSGEQPTFDTKASGSTDTSNTMVVNGQTYTGALPADAKAGLHVVVLESMSLRQISNQVLVTNKTSGDNRAVQAQAGKALAAAINQAGGPTVFVQTIGKPAGAGPEWESIVKPLVSMGANANLINALDGTAGYAFVGRVGAKAPPAESSDAYDKGPYEAPNYPPARLVGTLARSRASSFVPNVFSTPTTKAPNGTVNTALINIAYQPAQAWPTLPGTADESAKAQKLLCEAMKFCLAADSCPTLRECFWQRYSSDWDQKLTLLGNVGYPGDGRGFTKATFDGVKEELLKETADVGNVKNYLKQLQEPFEKSSLGSYVDLQGISKKIYDSVQVPPADNSTSWALGLVGKVAALGGFAGPPISAVAAGLSATFGLASYLSNKSGQPIMGTEITARSSELGSELLNRIELARKTSVGLGMILVSDYGKLAAVDQHVDTDWALPADIGPSVEAFRTSAKQWFYEALIPTAFPYLVRVKNANNARYLNCFNDGYGWPNQPDMFQMNAIAGFNTNGTSINGDFFFTKGVGGASSPSAQIGDEMFRPRSGPNPGLGMEKLQFFSTRVFGGRIIPAINNTSTCSTGYLPRFS